MIPFDYPALPYVRRHGPRGYAQLESYRPWLRDDFDFRCRYCLDREVWQQTPGRFAADHFQPIASHPHLELEYENLLYACVTCNALKGQRTVPDPAIHLLQGNVRIEENGNIDGLTPEAAALIEKLELNDDVRREFRRRWIGVVRLAKNHDPDLWIDLLRLPADLPDLARLRPPLGNVRPEGIATSYFARRTRDELAGAAPDMI